METWPRVICLLPHSAPLSGNAGRSQAEAGRETRPVWRRLSILWLSLTYGKMNIRPHHAAGAGAESTPTRRGPVELARLGCFHHWKETKFWDPISCNYLRLEFPETDSDRYRQFLRSSFQRTATVGGERSGGRGGCRCPGAFPASLRPCLPCSDSRPNSRRVKLPAAQLSPVQGRRGNG